jgi:hypothetical protein
MAITLWRPGRRLFSTAAVLMLLTAAAHTAGGLASRPENDFERQVFASMDSLKLPVGMGMNPSLLDAYGDLMFTMSVTTAGLGLLNLVIASSKDATDRLLRSIGWTNAIWVAGFLALSWHYQILPPVIFATIIEVFVLAGLLVPNRTNA